MMNQDYTNSHHYSVVVVAAVSRRLDNAVLITKRAGTGHLDGYWEWPGGKVEIGEVPHSALCRELFEELSVDVVPTQLEPLTFDFYDYGTRKLLLLFYAVQFDQNQEDTARSPELRWVNPRDLYQAYTFPPANRGAVAMLLQRSGTMSESKRNI